MLEVLTSLVEAWGPSAARGTNPIVVDEELKMLLFVDQ